MNSYSHYDPHTEDYERGLQDGRREVWKFIHSPCKHNKKERYLAAYPCQECYETKLKEWKL